MMFVYAIRVVLALVLLWDIPVATYMLIKLVNGGPGEVHAWIEHVTFMGADAFIAGSSQEHNRMIRFSYTFFGLMLLVVPPALYFFQRSLKRRVSK